MTKIIDIVIVIGGIISLLWGLFLGFVDHQYSEATFRIVFGSLLLVGAARPWQE